MTTAALPTAHFNFEGRTYRLYKKHPSADAHWYFVQERQGQRHRVCLHTPHLGKPSDPTSAIAKARQAIVALRNDTYLTYLAALSGRTAPAAPECCTIEQLLYTYENCRIPQGANDTTRHHNARDLRNLIYSLAPNGGEGRSKTALQQPSSYLDPAFVRAYLRHLESKLTTLDQLAARRAQRTAFSLLAHAASIVAPHVCLHLADAGLKLPDFTAFRVAVAAATRRAGKLAEEYRPPSDQTIHETVADWPHLPRNEYLAVGLALTCGLRAGEIAQARWDWFTEVHGRPFLRATAKVKNSTGRIEVQPIDPWFAQMMTRARIEGWQIPSLAPTGEEGQNQVASSFILTGGDTERTDHVFRRVSGWLRALGWRTQKTNHALRALAGSMVLKSYDLYTASVFLRHSNVQVTKDHYAYFLRPESISQPPLIRVEWARKDAPAEGFQPQVVAA